MIRIWNNPYLKKQQSAENEHKPSDLLEFHRIFSADKHKTNSTKCILPLSEKNLASMKSNKREYLSTGNLNIAEKLTEAHASNSVSNSSDEGSSDEDLSPQARGTIKNKLTKVTEVEDTSYLDDLLSDENCSPYEFKLLKGRLDTLSHLDLSRRGTASTTTH